MKTELSTANRSGRADDATGALSPARKKAILVICSMSLFIVGLDITVVNIALPAIERDLRAGISGLQWTVAAYTLAMASLLIFSGSTADRFGRRRILVTGLSVFSVGSLVCSLAPSEGLLIIARVLQGVGASMMTPVGMSIVTNTFTESRERAQAVGVWGAVFGISIALGPIVGGALVTSLGWRAIFWINIPVALAAIGLTLRYIPESRAPRPRRFDPVGQTAVTVLLGALTFGIIEAPAQGWLSVPILTAFTAAATAFATLIIFEPRRIDPLIELRFFKSIPFSSAIVASVAGFAAFGGFLFMTALYLQEVRGFSPIEAGIATVPMALMVVVAAPISGRIVGRRGPRVPLAISGGCFVIASAMLVGIDASTPTVLLLAAFLIFGTGFGFINAPVTNTAVSGMPRAQAGVASAIATTSRQIGHTLGVAIIGAIVAARGGNSVGIDFASASLPGWWLLATLGAGVLVLAFVGTSAKARQSAHETATALNPEALAL